MLAEVAHEDGGLARAVAGDEVIVVRGVGEGVVRLEDGEASTTSRVVPSSKVAVARSCTEFSGSMSTRSAGVATSFTKPRPRRLRCARFQPREQRRKFRRTHREPLPALVGERRGGLEQDEAVFRLDEIDPPASPRLTGQREPVEIRVLAAQRNFEAALAVPIAVAAAEDWHPALESTAITSVRKSPPPPRARWRRRVGGGGKRGASGWSGRLERGTTEKPRRNFPGRPLTPGPPRR